MGIFGGTDRRPARPAPVDVKQDKRPGSLQVTCDRCHAALAKVEVVTGAGSVFLCQHHHKEHRDSIIAAGHLIRAALLRRGNKLGSWHDRVRRRPRHRDSWCRQDHAHQPRGLTGLDCARHGPVPAARAAGATPRARAICSLRPRDHRGHRAEPAGGHPVPRTYAWLRRLVTACARRHDREAVLVMLDAPPADAVAGQVRRGRVAPAPVMRWNTTRWSELLDAAGSGALAAEGWSRVVVLDRAQASHVETSVSSRASAPDTAGDPQPGRRSRTAAQARLPPPCGKPAPARHRQCGQDRPGDLTAGHQSHQG